MFYKDTPIKGMLSSLNIFIIISGHCEEEVLKEEIADEVVKIGMEFLMAELEKRNKPHG